MALYEKLLKAGKEALDAAKVPFKVRKAEKDLESKIIDVEQEIADAELAVEEAKGSDPIKWDTLIDKTDELELKKRKLAQLNQIQKELFKD